MADKNPKLEGKSFPANIPVTLKVVKFVTKGNNNFGDWFLWEVEMDGVKYSLFPDEKFHTALKNHVADRNNVTVMVVKKEGHTDKGFTYYTWEVRDAIFDASGRAPEPPTASNTSEEGFDTYLASREQQMASCLRKVIIETELLQAECNVKFTSEDIRALAITLFLEAKRR